MPRPKGKWAGAAQSLPPGAGGTRPGPVSRRAGGGARGHAAALHDLAGSARTFLGEAALPAVRALNGAAASTLLPAMHRVVNAVRSGIIGREVALYWHWMKWRRSNRSGRPLSMGDALRLTGEGSATSLHSSDMALLHALRTRHSMDAAPYLNQARATYLGGLSELDAAIHLLHPQDGGLEVGKLTIFVEGAGETSTRPRATNPVYDGGKPTPRTPSCVRRSPESPAGVPPSPWPPRGGTRAPPRRGGWR